MDSQIETYKLILIGDSTVGKTNLLVKYVDRKSPENIISTIGIEFKNKTINLKNGRTIKLQIWDTSGQEKFRALTKNYFRGCSAGLFVFDVTNENSFENISDWLELYNDVNSEKSKKILIGNKIDKIGKRVVDKERMEKFAKENGFNLEPFEVSVQEEKKIDEMFEKIVELLAEKQDGGNNYINTINNIDSTIHNSKDDINHNSNKGNSINNINLNIKSNSNNNKITSTKLKKEKHTKKGKKKGFC